MTAPTDLFIPTVTRAYPYPKLEKMLLQAHVEEHPPGLSALPQHPLHWRSGEKLSQEAQRHFVLALLQEDAEHRGEMVRWVRPFLKDVDCYQLCRRLLDAVEEEEEVTWPLYIQAIIGSPYQVDRLGEKLDEVVMQEGMSTALDVVEILRRARTPAALHWLQHWSQSSQHPMIARASREALARLARQQSTSISIMMRDELPRLYLDQQNKRLFDFGPRKIEASLSQDLKITWRSLNDGHVYKSVPSPRQSDDMELAATARENMLQLQQDVRSSAKQQHELLESAMCHGRRWAVARWRSRFLIHPLLRLMSQGLVFAQVDSQGQMDSFMVSPQGTFLNAQDEEVDLKPGATIQVLHPVMLSLAQRARWMKIRGRHQLPEPPFKQLARPVFLREAYEVLWREPGAHLRTQLQTLQRHKRGSQYKGTLRKGAPSVLKRVLGPFIIEVHCEDNPDQLEHALLPDEVTCHTLRVTRERDEVPLSQLPDSVFSEITGELVSMFDLTQAPLPQTQGV